MPVPTVALCGAGMISGAHAAAATMLGLPIVGVASRSHQHAAEQAARLGTAALTYDDLPGSADLVIVATPPQCHADHVLAMLRAGAAVVVEKPLCTTLADADRLVQAAAAHGERVLYAENLAAAPMVTALLAAVPSIGDVQHLHVRALQSLPTWGQFTSDAWGGGALFDLGVHPVAIAVLVAAAAGAGEPLAVSATLRGGVGHNTDEQAEVEITFANGLHAQVVASWQATSQVWDVEVSSARHVLRGDVWPRPTLEHNGATVPLPGRTAQVAPIEEAGYAGQLQGFCDDLATGTTPAMSVEFGRAILDIVCAAYRSAGRGAPERLPFMGDRNSTPLQLWHATSA